MFVYRAKVVHIFILDEKTIIKKNESLEKAKQFI